jgi:hypothetical protein
MPLAAPRFLICAFAVELRPLRWQTLNNCSGREGKCSNASNPVSTSLSIVSSFRCGVSESACAPRGRTHRRRLHRPWLRWDYNHSKGPSSSAPLPGRSAPRGRLPLESGSTRFVPSLRLTIAASPSTTRVRCSELGVATQLRSAAARAAPRRGHGAMNIGLCHPHIKKLGIKVPSSTWS